MGGVLGGIIGNNNGHHAGTGAAIGAGAGFLLGALVGEERRSREVEYGQVYFSPQPYVFGGTVVGAASGAVIGSAVGHAGAGAVIGAGSGMVLGSIAAASTYHPTYYQTQLPVTSYPPAMAVSQPSPTLYTSVSPGVTSRNTPTSSSPMASVNALFGR